MFGLCNNDDECSNLPKRFFSKNKYNTVHMISLILKELLLLNSVIVQVSYVLLDNIAVVTFLALNPCDDY